MTSGIRHVRDPRRQAHEYGVDVVVVGSHERWLSRLFSKSVSAAGRQAGQHTGSRRQVAGTAAAGDPLQEH